MISPLRVAFDTQIIYSRFGNEEGKIPGYPGHEIAEMALTRLYEVTEDPKYLELSKFFINERGTKPYYFDQEHPEKVKAGEEFRYHYNQAHLPVREQEEAVGHAVRAVYLYSGMADVARLTGDESLKAACERLWDNLVQKKLYITGGIGGTHIGESFSFNYDLPNDTAYSETCAAIGLVFFARRMLQMNVDSRYADVMERALYNTVLSGMAMDGKSFFYVNPLEVNPEACQKDERKFHVKSVRQKWFGCACCPPNIARLLSSVGSYAYTENEDTLFMHLYVGGTIEKKYKGAEITWHVDSQIPWGNQVTITCQQVERTGEEKQTLAIRIPDWCDSYEMQCSCAEANSEQGYLYLTGEFQEGDRIQLTFNRKVRIMQANPKVSEDQGKVAVTFGPLVYCLEEADNGSQLHLLQVKPKFKEAKVENMQIQDQQIQKITLPGRKELAQSKELYRLYEEPEYEEKDLHFIPYYAWANRGEGEMRVWVQRM